MPLTYNGNAPSAVTYNVNPVSEVTYNGVTVWQNAPSADVSYLTYAATYSRQLDLYLLQSAANALSIDWGDGSPAETSSDPSEFYVGHQYITTNTYNITLTCQPGESFEIDYQGLGSGGLLAVVIGNACTKIGYEGFVDSTQMTSLTLGRGIAEIEHDTFQGCGALSSFTITAPTPPTLGANALGNIPATCPIYVPAASVAAYQAASSWSARAAYIQAIP